MPVAAPAASALEPRICEPGGAGLFLPLGGDAEQHLCSELRTLMYGVAMLYCFLGVSVIADVFMSAIEEITSKKQIVLRQGRSVEVAVWNSTVANLTLMALGSSAPEILLSVVEVFKTGFYSGDLGPSTIVGSAAFNLLVIVAACVMAVPGTEPRRIKEFSVFVVTAVFSVLAYAWLVAIVTVITPDVVDLWEAIVTFMAFPLLVAASYLVDVRCRPCSCLLPGLPSHQHLQEECQDAEGEAEGQGLAGSVDGAPAAADPIGEARIKYVRSNAQEMDEEDCKDEGTWASQIQEALYGSESEEEQAAASVLERLMSFAAVPWKVFFALTVPPPTYIGGWACFVCSLSQIGALTALIGDLAELFGCTAGLHDSVTAITVVALGTSLPDLFASKVAAVQDEFADGSIVNVTGSNSVNVFLGIGLPWFVAALYWRVNGATEEWVRKYPDVAARYTWSYASHGHFVVRGGNLTFSVAVFTLTALACLCLLGLRRMLLGGELGGPFRAKVFSSFLMVALWVFYIALSVWQIQTGSQDLASQSSAVLLGAAVLGGVAAVFGLVLLVVSKPLSGAGDPEQEGEAHARFADPSACRVCGSPEQDEGALVSCAGCDAGYHYACCGLDAMPEGSWFCPTCLAVQAAVQNPLAKIPHPPTLPAAVDYQGDGHAGAAALLDMLRRYRDDQVALQKNAATWTKVLKALQAGCEGNDESPSEARTLSP